MALVGAFSVIRFFSTDCMHLDGDLAVHVYLDMAPLHDPDGRPQPALDLAQVHHTCTTTGCISDGSFIGF